MLRLDAPFVLLDDARDGGAAARLYTAPVGIVAAYTPQEVVPALERLRQARRDGLHAAGLIAYEAGAALEPNVPAAAIDGPLLWFGLFQDYRTLAVDAMLPDPAGAWIGALQSELDEARHAAQFAEVKALIAAGDLYQVNLSFRATAKVAGDPLALYAGLRARSRAGWGAVVATGETTILSLSPEMFFALDAGRLTAKPMKGTARREGDAAADARAAQDLRDDPKQRAENLMIVDLMRNDLSRVARPGSVAVPLLFAVEPYPTVHQMVSTVTADLAEGRDAVDVLAALFPCGSITGAPKIRAMQAIADIEDSARGLYTGAIGRLDADGDAMFNVAIRTLTWPRGSDHVTLGIGSGIVADSVAADEWDECLAKAAFLTSGQRDFDLIETMAFDPLEGIQHLEAHLARMKASALALGFTFNRHDARNELQAATFRLRDARRIRLLLARSGAVVVEVGPRPAPFESTVAVRVVPLPVSQDDLRLRHKTSARGFYDAARAAAGTPEVLFETPDGYLTEGSYTNLFVARGDKLVTPPLAEGLLPGILRSHLIETGRAVEGRLTRDDLREGFLLGNALRGLFRAEMVAD
ncbi:aminodeoxychorismate synthase, component I [Sphingomonas sp. S17]|jgi:para-aminobenzoate synthetase/4-amino-4-deoxychorismate lyase|uniref:Probable branched-chain-amino-acid aminotransferase n=2 Tax=Sphingomonas paucimobilis TaxID=13689 RepID=A0A411LKT2_SPHPI|nr:MULTISPECIES: aminodeoxychorismate synthase component I [Sphingomonas]EGI55129.1 aminodeoxychorismate synthase, component I [Sphingomonas sp. S17]MBQ1480558.1 aminodeoxychorismate synthase component I [Sphingomonas sp.]MCM3680459.1 aminodeoxychorismate synthase component I [Sphingomonas paucimobilis]MDG5970125.1 aminodeoxychorismate synthase component I [Sphingomonas paucimobilis]NNG57368.1 aminodeoxychorismate synthase component I [Sphingomonas paucimobilis]